MNLKAAIYHFTDVSDKRPKIYMDELKNLEQFAVSLGFTVTEIFCDKSLLRSNHPEFERFLASCEKFDVLITKDFYHISKNTMKCMYILKELSNKGLKIFTMENGSFSWEDIPLDKPLRVATYNCHSPNINNLEQVVKVQNDIFKLFSKKKTAWTVVKQYTDESEHQNNGDQVQLMNLINEKENYDLLLVHNLNNIHYRTTNFCKIRDQLQLDIYSLQEGLIKYRR